MQKSECRIRLFEFRIPNFNFRIRMARYANWQSGEAQTFVPVGSTPTRATTRRLGIGEPQWL